MENNIIDCVICESEISKNEVSHKDIDDEIWCQSCFDKYEA